MPKQKGVIQTKKKEDNRIKRRFIIMGERNSGKSTLGNLLLGPRESQLFATAWYTKPSVKATGMQMGQVWICKMHAGEIRCTCLSNEKLKIEVIDDPNCTKPEKHKQFLEKGVDKRRNPERITFLILINSNSCSLSGEFKKIKDAEQILSKLNFELFTNAIVVFTHVDELVLHSKETPEQILNKKLQQKEFVYVKRLLDLVHQRYMFINTMNFSRINRNEILNKLFEFDNWDSDFGWKIIDKLRDLNTAYDAPIMIFSDNTQDERKVENYQEVLKLRKKIPKYFELENKVDSFQYTCIGSERNEANCKDLINTIPPQIPESNSNQQAQNTPEEQRSSTTDKVNVNYLTAALNELSTSSRIEPSTPRIADGDKSSIPEEKDIGKEIVNTLRELSIEINTPIIIILIQIRDNFDEEIYTHILRLIKNDNRSLMADKQLRSPEFMGLVFELSFKNGDIFIDKMIENQYLRDLVEKVNHRYVCITEEMSASECSRILKNFIRTKFQNETTEILNTKSVQKSKQNNCNRRETAEKQDGITTNKFDTGLSNWINVAEKNILSNLEDEESMITLHNSMVFANEKSKVPLFSYFTFDKMSSTETDWNDDQDPGPQLNY